MRAFPFLFSEPAPFTRKVISGFLMLTLVSLSTDSVREGVAADDHVIADLRRAAEQRRAGIDGHVAADLRVTAGGSLRARWCIPAGDMAPSVTPPDRAARGHRDDGRLADDHAGTVVDGEILRRWSRQG